jgi:uncharacterized membrane protein
MQWSAKRLLTLLAVVFVVAAVGVTVLALAFPNLDKSFASVLNSVVSAMSAVLTVKYFQRQDDEVQQDERTLKIQNKAMASSWWLTYLFIAVLIWVSYFKIYALEAENVLSLVFFFMIASYAAMQFWLSSRGDA